MQKRGGSPSLPHGLRKEEVLVPARCCKAGSYALQPEEHAESLADVDHHIRRSLRFKHDSPSLPIEVLDVIGEDDP